MKMPLLTASIAEAFGSGREITIKVDACSNSFCPRSALKCVMSKLAGLVPHFHRRGRCVCEERMRDNPQARMQGRLAPVRAFACRFLLTGYRLTLCRRARSINARAVGLFGDWKNFLANRLAMALWLRCGLLIRNASASFSKPRGSTTLSRALILPPCAPDRWCVNKTIDSFNSCRERAAVIRVFRSC